MKHNANPNTKAHGGETAVHVAMDGVKRGKGKDVLAALLQAGGNLEVSLRGDFH